MEKMEADSVEIVKEEILNAMKRGLNVTANAVHIRDLAEAYAFLEGTARGQASVRRAATPLVKP